MNIKSLFPVTLFSKTDHCRLGYKDFDTQPSPRCHTRVINNKYLNSQLEQNLFGFMYTFKKNKISQPSPEFLAYYFTMTSVS